MRALAKRSLTKRPDCRSRTRDRRLPHHTNLLAALRQVDLDPRADPNLASPPPLRFAIDHHGTADNQSLRLAAVCHEIRELEQGSQPNDITADFDLHTASLAYRLA
jgi:hypothetical protein